MANLVVPQKRIEHENQTDGQRQNQVKKISTEREEEVADNGCGSVQVVAEKNRGRTLAKKEMRGPTIMETAKEKKLDRRSEVLVKEGQTVSRSDGARETKSTTFP